MTRFKPGGVYRVIGRMKGEGLSYILGFRSNTDISEWLNKGWKECEITFIKCNNRE